MRHSCLLFPWSHDLLGSFQFTGWIWWSGVKSCLFLYRSVKAVCYYLRLSEMNIVIQKGSCLPDRRKWLWESSPWEFSYIDRSMVNHDHPNVHVQNKNIDYLNWKPDAAWKSLLCIVVPAVKQSCDSLVPGWSCSALNC